MNHCAEWHMPTAAIQGRNKTTTKATDNTTIRSQRVIGMVQEFHPSPKVKGKSMHIPGPSETESRLILTSI